jgi:hypothetical protein
VSCDETEQKKQKKECWVYGRQLDNDSEIKSILEHRQALATFDQQMNHIYVPRDTTPIDAILSCMLGNAE